MQQMEEKILKEGQVLPGGILKVGNFLNQQIDTVFLREMGEEIARLYEGTGVTKILTIESSGIAIGAAAGIVMKVPLVFAKKHKTSNVDGDVYTTVVHSFTHNADYNVVVSRDYLVSGDRVLLVDDFLAAGNAMRGLIDLCRQADAEVVGAAVAIEKRFQGGGDRLRAEGIRVEPMACIASMDDEHLEFCTV
ncbi:MAG: xanthine phosphoribosyltransferase [Eubacterium sp.]|nr:xanthine phosphoribosyltransferase [Eubacterium sp.]